MRVASADLRGSVGTARLQPARFTRSLPSAVSPSLVSLVNLISSCRGFGNHVAVDFLRYPFTNKYRLWVLELATGEWEDIAKGPRFQ